MTMEADSKEFRAMAFWRDNFSTAYQLAIKFAGNRGRIATLPDIIDARIDGPELPHPLAHFADSRPWSQYITTFTGEYFGYSQAGNPLIVVAHGIGPLSTPEGIAAAYNSRLKPKRNGRRGGEGRISHRRFLNLVDGKYGPVAIVDFNDYSKRYTYPLLEHLSATQALEDPLVHARLGPRFEGYLAKLAAKSDAWANYENERRAMGQVELFGSKITRQIGQERFNILTMRDASNCSYQFVRPDEAPIAHLLTVAQIHISNGESLNSEVYCTSHLDSIRLVGVRGEGPVEDICPSIDIDNEIVARHLPRFLVPTTGNIELPELMKVRNYGMSIFTERVDGTGQGNGEIEYLVTEFETIDELMTFTTEVHGYYGIFRYDLVDVAALAPEGANAYYWEGDAKIEDNGRTHSRHIQFYRVKVDTTHRIPPLDEIRNDFDTLMWIADQEYNSSNE